jgi:lipid II:glycine glycyltransferase (peptidoglycan interpeptide bridge formation enzyme)
VTERYQVRVSKELEDESWDRFLAQTPSGHHVQTSLWAQVKAVMGWRPARLVISRDGEIVAGAQILMRPIPILGAVGYVSKGPLLASPDPALTTLVVTQLQRLAKARRIQHLSVQPPGEDNRVVQELVDKGFQPSSTNVAPRATSLLDLSKDLETIMADMNRGTRYNIRLSGRKGITVREGSRHDLDSYYQMLAETGKRQNFTPYPKRYFTAMWRHLYPRGYLKLFIAEFEGDPVAGQLAVAFGDVVINKLSVWSGREGKRRPNEAIQWACIEWASSEGYRYYDFEGIELKAAKALLQGESLPDSLKQTVTSYKLGFGGEAVLYASPYAYLYNPLYRWAFEEFYPKIKDRPVVKRTIKRLRTQ